jgi:hypothetical protein
MRRIKQATAGILIAVATIPGLRDLGSAVESRAAPVRGAQSIDYVQRGDGALCWQWDSEKLRPLNSDDLDVRVTDGSGVSSLAAVYNPATRSPWRYGASIPLGTTRQYLCLDIPPWVRPTDWLRVEQTIRYPGLLGLWPVYTKVPDVEHPGRP